MSRFPILPPDSQPVVPGMRLTTPWRDWAVALDRLARPILTRFASASALPLEPLTVATLPAAADSEGTIAYVTDATATTRLSTVAGGGANKVLVYSNATNWLIV